MIAWFKKQAPIRRKFDVLLVTYTGLTAIPVATTWLASDGRADGPLLLGLAAAALAAVTLVTWAARHLITGPYVGTVVRMEALAAGDLTSPIEFSDYGDCVGRMTRAMDVFRRHGVEVERSAAAQKQITEALGAGLGRVAVNDLTHRIETPFPEGYEQLRVDYHRAIDAVAEAMTAVSQSTGGINTGAGDIRQASDDLSQRTEQQAASLEETAAAMDQITSTVRETAAGAVRANAVVSEARQEAERSGEVVARAVDAMSGIERASAEISDIISVIDGIAFQTNLLALNAGVEAARAGDAGKGFAVVASEVRALAQRSADAAKDVKTRITASTEQVEAGVELVGETGKALTRIIGRIGEISTLVATIAHSAEQQSTGLQQVNTAVSEMDGVTQQNAAMVEQATAAARSLLAEADELSAQVAQFRLGDPAPAHRPASPVRALQARAAAGARRIARPAATAVAGDRWAAF